MRAIGIRFFFFFVLYLFLGFVDLIAQPLGTLPIHQGMAALTCYSGDRTQGASDPNGYVLAIYDIREPNCNGNNAPFGPNNWLAPSTGAYHHNTWTASNLGEIFGIDLQVGSATPDIFVTSSGLTARSRASTLVAPGGTGGDVFRINGTTGAITKLASLPNTIYDPHPNNTGVFSKYVGLGNISHNNTHNVLYVTNLDNGLLYVLNATTGAILGTYDHLPGTPDNPSDIFTTNLRQVYGVEYNPVQNRLYYAVPTSVDACVVNHPTAGNGEARYVTANSIYSLGVNPDGTLNASDRVLVATIPTQTQIQCVNNPGDSFNSGRAYYGVISDIEFNSDYTSMLIAERTLAHRFQPFNNPTKPTDLEFYAHESRAFRYDLSGSAWSQSVTYSVGDYNGKLTNSSGGISFGYNNYGTCGTAAACDDAMVVLSDALRFENVTSPPLINIYGILISDINGNTSGYPSNSYFIDLDGFIEGLQAIDAKSTLGDIDVFTYNCLTVPTCTNPSATVTPTNPSCTGANAPNNGTLTINGFSSGQRYQYSIGATFNSGSAIPASITTIPGTGVIVNNLTNTTQQYTVRIYDAADNTCFVDRTIQITSVVPPTAQCTKTDDLNCATPNGTATVTTNATQILWSTGSTLATITGLSAGTYTVTVTNTSTGCTNTCEAIITNNTTNPIVTCAKTDNTNCATPNGTATATATGVTYLWGSNAANATTATITGLSAGTYIVTVTSTTTGCTATCSAIVASTTTPPTAVCTPVANTNCASPNGSASVSTNAANPTYLWSTGAMTAMINNLAAGTYTVTVTDPVTSCINTCEAVITNNTTNPIVTCAKTDKTNCATPNGTATATATGVTYLWGSNASNATTATITGLSAGTYIVTVTSTTTGCTATCSAIVASTTTPPTAECTPVANTNCTNPNGSASVSTNAINPTYLWSTGAMTAMINNLDAGTYTVTVTDPVTGCTNTCEAVVGSTTTLPTATCSPIDNTNCTTPNGSATVTTNGNQISWSTGGTSTMISGLSAGTYTVTVTNSTTGCSNTCTAVVNNATVNPTCTITANSQPSCANLTGGSVTVNPNPAGTYTYVWSNAATTQTITGLSGGTYTVTMTNTTTGCTGTCTETLATPTNCCNIQAIVPQNLECLDNGTPALITDNRIRFSANVTNTNLSLTGYNVTINGGTTITPNTNVPYGLTQFTLGTGTAGGGATFTVTVTDITTPGCTQTFQVTDPGNCNISIPCPTPKCGTATIQINGN